MLLSVLQKSIVKPYCWRHHRDLSHRTWGNHDGNNLETSPSLGNFHRVRRFYAYHHVREVIKSYQDVDQPCEQLMIGWQNVPTHVMVAWMFGSNQLFHLGVKVHSTLWNLYLVPQNGSRKMYKAYTKSSQPNSQHGLWVGSRSPSYDWETIGIWEKLREAKPVFFRDASPGRLPIL